MVKEAAAIRLELFDRLSSAHWFLLPQGEGEDEGAFELRPTGYSL
jgi:hypothetical protein